jgi:hypothetical protein
MLILIAQTGVAQAEIKAYDSGPYGTPSHALECFYDSFLGAVSCSPQEDAFGYERLLDEGLGTVTLEEIQIRRGLRASLTPIPGQGPNSFVFVDGQNTTFITSPHVSEGPASSSPGGRIEWGIVEGWEITGYFFCVSSPESYCGVLGGSHGTSVAPFPPSTTYDLGTWDFDTVGDMASEYYIHQTTFDGLANRGFVLRGAFQGASLPALPAFGFGALGAGLMLAGARSLVARR